MPPLRGKPPKEPPPPLTPLQKLERLAASGYVDVNDAGMFIKDVQATKPDRHVLRELKLSLLKRQGVFDRGAFHKLKTFCDTYKSENDVD